MTPAFRCGSCCVQVLADGLRVGVGVRPSVGRAVPRRDGRSVRVAGGRVRQASVDDRGAPARLLRHRRPTRQDPRDARTLPRGGAQPRHRGTSKPRLMSTTALFFSHHIVWLVGGSVAEWLACWTQALKGPGPNRSRDAVG